MSLVAVSFLVALGMAGVAGIGRFIVNRRKKKK